MSGEALAQGQGQGLGGGGQGAGSGGTSGGNAGPQGAGSGGSTAGGSGNGNRAANGNGNGNGPGSVNQNRYGGGTTVVPPPTPPDPTTTNTTTTVMQLLDSGGGNGGESFTFSHRCADHYAAGLSADKRITGNNLQFLVAAQGYVAPAFDPGNNSTGVLLLANYQEELEKMAPDPEVAGTYLGLAATRPITEPIVARVNALLCVATSTRITNSISEIAEYQRKNGRH